MTWVALTFSAPTLVSRTDSSHPCRICSPCQICSPGGGFLACSAGFQKFAKRCCATDLAKFPVKMPFSSGSAASWQASCCVVVPRGSTKPFQACSPVLAGICYTLVSWPGQGVRTYPDKQIAGKGCAEI